MKYFAYGSNCDPAVMEKKQVRYSAAERALLDGYRLLFNKRSLRKNLPEGIGFANINEDSAGQVEGILYEIADEDLPRLDESERYPDHYTRIDITVKTQNATVPCFTYQAQPDKIETGLRPSRNYLDHILAARDFLSWQYFEALDKSLTFHDHCVCCEKTSEIVFVREGEDLHMLCQPCREARRIWGEVRGRKLTVGETRAVMTQLVLGRGGFDSIQKLIEQAIEENIISA